MTREPSDHPVAYADFHGDIPAGHYGAGHVDIWDRGTWMPQGDPHAGLREGHLAFTLDGATAVAACSLRALAVARLSARCAGV